MPARPTESDSPFGPASSRRALLGRLAAAGLVAGGLLPDAVAAERRRRHAGREDRRDRRDGAGEAGARVTVIDQRSPALRPAATLRPPGPVRDEVRTWTVEGTVAFEALHLGAMRRGTRFGLTAELVREVSCWGPCVSPDFPRTQPVGARLEFPANPAAPAASAPILFRRDLSAFFDVRNPFDEDEDHARIVIYARLQTWRDSGLGWVKVGEPVNAAGLVQLG